MARSSDGGVKSAERALEIVELLADQGPLGFTELTAALDLPRSSAHGLLATLRTRGWVHQDDAKRYVLGLRAWQTGQAYTGHRGLAEIAGPEMDRLCDELGETVQLARLDGLDNVYIAISHSAHPMRLMSAVGMRLPAYATGIGKALLSTLPSAEARHRLADAELLPQTPRTVTDPELLLDLVETTRAIGFATDDEEYVSGCRCVAVPLTSDGETSFATALSVTMPTSRTGADWPMSVQGALTMTAAAIRASLGLSGARPVVPVGAPEIANAAARTVAAAAVATAVT